MPSKTRLTPAPGPVLLCLDLQPVFLDTLADATRLLRRCSLAIESAQLMGIPVVFTEQVPQKLGTTHASLLPLAPGALCLGKGSFSALADHGIRETLLQSLQSDHLLLCGLETPICVYQTAVDALRAQVPVTILSDCVGARRESDASVALTALERAGANVLPAESVFYSMLGDAAHPQFRSFTKLVKKHA